MSPPTPGLANTRRPLVQHLLELRRRLLWSGGVVLAIFLGCLPFSNELYAAVSAPLRVWLPPGSGMIATEVTAPFLVPFKLTLVTALFLAIPFVLHQLWAFMAPGLYRREKRLAVPLLVSSVALFYTGAAFAYYLVFPLAFGFLTHTGPEHVAIMTDIGSYLDFVLGMFLAFGVSFEIPVAIVLVVAARLATRQAIRRYRPYVVVGCFILGMLLTPPDVISQLLLAIPMWLLFEAGLLLSRWVPCR